MNRTSAGAGLAGLAIALVTAFGCSSNSTQPVIPPLAPERIYRFQVLGPGGIPVIDAAVEARTADSTYRATTEATGAAVIRIPNERALPAHVVFTANSAAVTPAAAAAGTAAGGDYEVGIACAGRPGTVLVRGATLKHLGDGLADEGTPNELQAGLDGAQVDYGFTLLAIPARMPSYRLSVRGLESLVELRINGHVVGRLRPPANVNDLTVQADTLIGTPAGVFLLTQNVFTIRTVGLPSNAANLDDIEVGALMVYYP
jgi:hypothetical protein